MESKNALMKPSMINFSHTVECICGAPCLTDRQASDH